jgi:hypothetical protein
MDEDTLRCGINHHTSIKSSICWLSDGGCIIHSFQVVQVLQSPKGDE